MTHRTQQTPAHLRPVPTIPIHIRWCIRRDMPEVLGIEEANFDYPWSEDDFVHYLRQRNCIAMVAEHHERVIGFFVYELHKNRLHILNFAVHAACQRQGVGAAMIRKLVSKLSPQRRNSIIVEVRESNLDSQLFFKAMGFKAIEVVHDWYGEHSSELAYRMRYRYAAQEPVSVRIAR